MVSLFSDALSQTMPDETGIEKSGMDLYFIERGAEGANFKATVFFEPYFYLDVSDPRRMMEITNALLKRFEGCKVKRVELEDLDLPNHLSGKKHPFLKVSFGTVNEMMDAKSQLRCVN
jgi:DNA polymerase epsilon subunit 1